MADRQFLVLEAKRSLSHPLVQADLIACFGGGLPILMTGFLNDKHVARNWRLPTRRGTSYVIMPTLSPV
jgi:hypothetical protein